MLKPGDPVPAHLLPDPAEALREHLNPKLRIAEAHCRTPDGKPWPWEMAEDGALPEGIGRRESRDKF
jgi:hypothetical protein